MVCSLSVLDTTFHIDTENHVCIFDMKVQTNFFLGEKKQRLKGNLRREGRRVCGVNIFKIHYISTLKCPHKTKDCVQWK